MALSGQFDACHDGLKSAWLYKSSRGVVHSGHAVLEMSPGVRAAQRNLFQSRYHRLDMGSFVACLTPISSRTCILACAGRPRTIAMTQRFNTSHSNDSVIHIRLSHNLWLIISKPAEKCSIDIRKVKSSLGSDTESPEHDLTLCRTAWGLKAVIRYPGRKLWSDVWAEHCDQMIC